MAEPAGPFHALWLGDQQFLCYCSAQDSGGFNIYVTNASEMWSTNFTLEKLEGHAQSGMCPSEDYSTKFREAFEHRAAALTVHDSKATLQLKEGTWSLTFDLFKLPCSEARKQLQALMFGLVGHVSSLEKRLEAAEDATTVAAASCSPEKNLLQSQRLLIPDLSPRKNRGGGSAMTAKRRVPGESLINPGFKSVARCPVRCIDWTPKVRLPWQEVLGHQPEPAPSRLWPPPSYLHHGQADRRLQLPSLPQSRGSPAGGGGSKKAPTGVDFEDS
ncbi:protein PAXX isoform X2 [Dermochelys coriacea]|uniref:protein PAXX isoform X2 n=1 Tax=Dermochelys coriacea TaxID=27794 RepID=UPI001CA7D08E|nr:protein PAXX isoform X2 [Dermochelys coriacea]